MEELVRWARRRVSSQVTGSRDSRPRLVAVRGFLKRSDHVRHGGRRDRRSSLSGLTGVYEALFGLRSA